MIKSQDRRSSATKEKKGNAQSLLLITAFKSLVMLLIGRRAGMLLEEVRLWAFPVSEVNTSSIWASRPRCTKGVKIIRLQAALGAHGRGTRYGQRPQMASP